MDILTYYKEKNLERNWYDNYFSVGHNKMGKLFAYTTTNYRTLNSFIKNFQTFEEVEGLPRHLWPSSGKTNQEKHKQHKVNMISSRLFYEKDGKVFKTEKGRLYSRFINSDFTKEERWLINYIFLLDSYLNKQKNYITSRSLELYNNYSTIFMKEEIYNILEEFLGYIKNDIDYDKLFELDFFYLHSISNDYDFLFQYKISSDSDKKKLTDYIKNNHKGDCNCCLSKKYCTSGNYNLNMICDDAKTLYFSLRFLQIKEMDYSSIIKKMVNIYNEKFSVHVEKILDFLLENKNIFIPIILNLYEIDNSEETEEVEDINDFEISYIEQPEDRIDDTTYNGRNELDRIFASRKKIAREQSNYMCELSELNSCRYFTSKVTNENYVELHHLIPREFRNDFQYSLEVLANYITVCPHCHKMLHLATDRERKQLITYLYNKRKERLRNVKLNIELDELLQYYKIEN